MYANYLYLPINIHNYLHLFIFIYSENHMFARVTLKIILRWLIKISTCVEQFLYLTLIFVIWQAIFLTIIIFNKGYTLKTIDTKDRIDVTLEMLNFEENSHGMNTKNLPPKWNNLFSIRRYLRSMDNDIHKAYSYKITNEAAMVCRVRLWQPQQDFKR